MDAAPLPLHFWPHHIHRRHAISAAFGLYQYVVPSRADPQFGRTVANAAAGSYGLRIGLAWWIRGTALATGYFVFVYRRFAGKV